MPTVYMNDPALIAGYDRTWLELVAAVASRRHPFHVCTLATVDIHGLPQARTMVLRGADRDARFLQFNSDVRSPKIAEMREKPAACAVFYGEAEKIQVRAWGIVSLHCNDPVSATVWQTMQPISRENYRSPFAPGSGRAAEGTESVLLSPADAYENLAVCRLRLSALEWLSLSRGGHDRARHEFAEDGSVSARWLNP